MHCQFKNCLLGVLLCLLATPLLDAGLVIIQDDFSANTTPVIEHRAWDSRIDTGWRSTRGFTSIPHHSLWDNTGGQLVNTATVDPTGQPNGRYTESESPVWQWFTNPLAGSANETSLNIEFDYSTDGADAVFFHIWAVQSGGPTGSNGFITNIQGWVNGNSGQNQSSSSGGYVPYNLTNGSNQPSNGSLSGALNGTGSYQTSIDISTLSIPGVTSIGDVDTFFIAFAGNETGGGTTTVDNLMIMTVAVPEPSGLLMFCTGLASFIGRRRRVA